MPTAVPAQVLDHGTSRGALLRPFESPTSGSKGLAPPKSEIQQREEQRKQRKISPGLKFDKSRKHFPPQVPGDTSTSNTDPVVRKPNGKRDTDAVVAVAPLGPPIGGASYVEKGPMAINNGQSEQANPVNRAIGAANSIAAHPTDPNVLYAGFVNGGIWKTSNATAASPTWIPQTDNIASLSIGDVTFDLSDPTYNTLVAGVGLYSSLGRIGGKRIGLLRTTNGGTNWTVLDGSGSLTGKNIRAAVARGSNIVVAVDIADDFTFTNIGIFRSTNAGVSFTQISGAGGSGLPSGRCWDMQADPVNHNTLYTAVYDSGTNNGIYKSTNLGQNWTRVSNAEMNTLVLADVQNIRLSVGTLNNIFAAIVKPNRLANIYGSIDGGTIWTPMGVPTTLEGTTAHGVHVGGQGGIHMSIAADPTIATVVYIGGDRQPGAGDTGGAFPNSLGAQNYSGRLFRGNSALPALSRWQHLTHANNKGVAGGGTASVSAPHADSRDMAFDTNGRLIQGDDGGVYVRTSPLTNTGDWFSLQGSLVTTEVHDVAYDSVSNKLVAGTQDNGTPTQQSDNTWTMLSQGDGGDVAIDDHTYAMINQSIRFTSFQYLGNLARRTYNATGNLLSTTYCNLTPAVGSPAIEPQFYTPVEVNRHNAAIIIGARNGLYESTDNGNTVALVSTLWAGDGSSGVGLDYGGKKSGAASPAVIYGVDSGNLYTRTTAGGTFTTLAISTGGDILLDVVMDTENYSIAYCVDKNQVFKVTGDGTASTAITGDLGNVGNIRCIEYIPNATGGTIVIGSQTGVYVAQANSPTVWQRLGTNLPVSAFVYDIDYDQTDNVLVAGTLGRSIWMIDNASGVATGSAVGDWKSY